MSIERDQDFEQLEDIAAMMAENPGIEFENGKYVYYGLDPRTAFAVVYIGGAWAGWQAKANAVPEGFVLVPICASEETKQKMLRVFNESDRFLNCENIYKAMIEAAQESAND